MKTTSLHQAEPASANFGSLLQKPDIARRANVSIRTVDDWVKSKKIPSIKIGRTIRFRWPAVEAALLKFERKAIG